MKKKTQKTAIDTNSIHKGLIDSYKDEVYAKFLSDVKNNLEEQKAQLFKLKLTNAETNVASMLANVNEDATSNDFIAIEREIKRYSDVVFNLKSESSETSEKRSLWNSHHNKINIFHNRLQKKRIQRSVKALSLIHISEPTRPY